MKNFMRWKEIQKKYPNEHVVIVNLKTSLKLPAKVKGGEVLDHDTDWDALIKRCDTSSFDRVAFLYTGDRGALIGERGMVRVIEHD